MGIRKTILILLAILTLVSMTGCNNKNDTEKVIYIADQYGLAYAPLQIMKAEGFLEAQLGDEYEVKWVKLANTAAIREAMLAEDLDIGFMGIPPFLIGVEQEMEWKIISGLAISPVSMVALDDDITALEDLVDAGQIALPQPGSIQHILLQMAAEQALGDAYAFDHQLISMKHPDGMQALMVNEDVKAHFTAPPYLFQELALDGGHLIVDGTEAMGEQFTFIVGVCRASFRENEEMYEAFNRALDQSISFINDYPKASIEQLSKDYEIDAENLEDYLYGRGIEYTDEVLGLDRFMTFMAEHGYLEQTFEMDDIMWD